jgi:hypothetical protein
MNKNLVYQKICYTTSALHAEFSIGESLAFGWQKTKAHSGVIFPVLLINIILMGAYSIVANEPTLTLMGMLWAFALGVGGFITGTGLTLIALRIAQGKHVEFKNIIPLPELLWRYLLAGVLVGLVVMGGIILFIIPGIYFALKFSMVRFAVLDGLEVMESLDKSTKLTEGVKWRLMSFYLALLVINVLGAMAFFVGLLVTIPVTLIAYAHVYQKLHTHHHGHHMHGA